MKTWDHVALGPDDAAQALRAAFPGLTLTAEDGPLVLRYSGAAEERWSLHRLSVVGSLALSGSIEGPFAVGRVRPGSATLTYATGEVDTTGP